MFYGKSRLDFTANQFMKYLYDYLKWYSEKRIKISLGGLSPIDYRKSSGLLV